MSVYHLLRYSQTNGTGLNKAPGYPNLLEPHHHRRPLRADTSAFLERWTPSSRRMTGQALTLEQRKEITTEEYEGFKHNFPEVFPLFLLRASSAKSASVSNGLAS